MPSLPRRSRTCGERRLASLSTILLVTTVEAGWWRISGPCSTAPGESDCVVSPGFPWSNYGNSQTCTMRWMGASAQWYLHPVSFDTEGSFDVLTVNGRRYSGIPNDLMGERPPLWGDIYWRTDESITRAGWKLCARPRDELPTPSWSVSGPCPIPIGDPECVTSPNWPNNYGPSEHCEMSIQNGAGRYVQLASFSTISGRDHLHWNGNSYSGGVGPSLNQSPEAWSTSPLRGVVTWSTDKSVALKGWKICARDRSDVYWNVAGPCTAAPNEPHCVTSPNYPYHYNNWESCVMTVPNHDQTYLQAVSFQTQSSLDHLDVNGHSYSGSGTGLVGSIMSFSGQVTWRSGRSATRPGRQGWKICAYTSIHAVPLSLGAGAEVSTEKETSSTITTTTSTLSTTQTETTLV